MHETVIWSDNNCPSSPRFNDVYRSRNGGLVQAETVFLGGCQLPQRWREVPQFCVLETGFGLGLNFLATWNTWQQDDQRCTVLHYVAIEAYPVSTVDLLHSAKALAPPNPALCSLAAFDIEGVMDPIECAGELFGSGLGAQGVVRRGIFGQTLPRRSTQVAASGGAFLLTSA